MHLKSIKLRDWKAFAGSTVLDFPKPSRSKNVVLIGAPNGFGKTTLLEALLFGLYGKDAWPLVSRASSSDQANAGYQPFLKRALHAKAIEEGRTSMSVELTFEDPDDDPSLITVSRTWWFKQDGDYREEEVRIWEGPTRRALRASPMESDKEDFYRGYIARHTLPPHLAQFFLFDGERVQKLAQQDTSDQVRLGIEGLLGATVLRAMRQSLMDYASERRKATNSGASDEALTQCKSDLEKLEKELAEKTASLEVHNEGVKRHALAQSTYSAEIQSLNSGGLDNISELGQKCQRADTELESYRDTLLQILNGDMSLALAGRGLLQQVLTRLQAEGRHEAWKRGLEHSKSQLQRFESSLWNAPPPLDPPLHPSQRETLKLHIAHAWTEMWHPAPNDCADSIRHTYLADTDREWCVSRIRKCQELSLTQLNDLLNRIQDAEKDRQTYRQQIQALSSIGPRLKDVTDKLSDASHHLGECRSQVESLKREITSIGGLLQSKKAEHERLSSKYASARPLLGRIATAEKIASEIPNLVADATKKWVDTVADLMTEAYKEIAHKGAISRVDIDSKCNVRLLTDAGRNHRELDLSAGEDQVFSFALISAIARATNVRFPIVIDTPLARLDRTHRLNILRHFSQRAGEQVILLSQDTEVVAEYLKEIKGRVAKTFTIRNELVGNSYGQARVIPDVYFESI